jgi:formylglycine-generating enzyme required for sulfatase activity
MVAIPGTTFDLESTFRIRECGLYGSDPYEDEVPTRLHQLRTIRRRVTLRAFALDVTPVTNDQFAAFLRESAYRPQFSDNFLKHWGHGHAPWGHEAHPVVYVDLEDARAYARWAGKRLPTEAEWQYAAQGPEGLKYPWGEEFLPDRCNDRRDGQTTPVLAYPDGRSPFGVHDLCGNTWEWTESERRDGHTRFAILKGGSGYRAQGSDWYFDGGPQANSFAAKYLLLWPGLDRCATIGFRCAVDR